MCLGHPSLFHAVTSLLNGYKMGDISYRLKWMKFISMLSMYVRSGTHGHFYWRISVVWQKKSYCSDVYRYHCVPKLSWKYIETWAFVVVSGQWSSGKNICGSPCGSPFCAPLISMSSIEFRKILIFKSSLSLNIWCILLADALEYMPKIWNQHWLK